jgi:hypothetical protein
VMRVSDANRPHGQWPGSHGYGPPDRGTMPMSHGPSGRPQTAARPPGRPQRAPRPPKPQQEKQGWVLKALGLVAVAVVSGMLWWLIQQNRDQPPPETQPNADPATVGDYNFVRHPEVPTTLIDSDCANHAYDDIEKFLDQNRCALVARALFTTNAEGQQVYTSVSVVRMQNLEDATKLKQLTDLNGTGNVNDIIKEKTVKVTGLTTLANGGYASAQHELDVIIVESDWAPEGKRTKDQAELLKKISTDAIRLGDDIRDDNQG